MDRPVKSRVPCLLALACLVAPRLAAQTHLQLFAGGVSANVAIDSSSLFPNKSARSGFTAGVGVSIALTNRLAFAPEVAYIEKGVEATDDSHIVTDNVKISYLSVPLLLRLAVGEGRFHPFVLGGGAVGFKLSCKQHLAGLGQTITQDCNTGGSNATASDIGMVVGGGVAVGRLSASVRYEVGIKNINSDSDHSGRIRNRAVVGLISFEL